MKKIHHYLIPHPENNHRAKALKPSAFLIYFLFLLFLPLFFGLLSKTKPEVLGIFSRVSVDELYSLVNKEREKIGLPTLRLEENLTSAATLKGQDMLKNGYWAHVSQDGKTPWFFIQKAGYQYQAAGENLGRNFESSESLVSAWMASPTHKRNILDSDFSDVGLAVLEGTYGGKKTTLVVQMFGKPKEDYLPVSVARAVPTIQKPETGGVKTASQLNPFTTTKNLASLIVFLVAGLLIVDFVVLTRRKIIRISGNSLAHLSLLVFLILVLWYTTSGLIL